MTAPTLRGRSGEVALIHQALDEAKGGQSAYAVCLAEAGYGKTRLLQEAAELARQRNVRVCLGGAERSFSSVPFMTLMSALVDGPEALVEPKALRAFPSSPDHRLWLIHELAARLGDAAATGPVCVLLDDLQWADDVSMLALRSIAPRLADLPLVWILAMRPGMLPAEVHRTLERLDALGAKRLSLGPLDPSAVRQLVADLSGGPAAPSLIELADTLQGNPYLLVELLSGLRDESRLIRIDGEVQVKGDGLPGRLRDSMQVRLNRHSPLARQVAGVAAVLGRRFTHVQLAAMTHRPATGLLEPVAELVASGVLAEREGKLAFPHDLIREAVLDALPPSSRRVLQRQAVDVLLAEGTSPVEVARQLADTAEPGDRAAASLLSRAAQSLSGSDSTTAADLAVRAVELVSHDDAMRAPLVAQAAVLLHMAGRSADGQALAQGALQEVLPVPQQAEIYLTIALMTGAPAAVREQACLQGLSLKGLDPATRLRLRALLAYSVIHVGRLDEVRELLPALARENEAVQDPTAEWVLETAKHSLAIMDDRYADGLTAVRAFQVRGGSGADTVLRMTHTIVMLLAMRDEFTEAEQVLDAALAAAERTEQILAVHTYRRLRGRLWAAQGRLDDAKAVLESTVGVDSPPGNAIEMATLADLCRLAVRTGDRDLARELAQVALQASTSLIGEAALHAFTLLAFLRMAEGDPTGARKFLPLTGVVLPRFGADPAHPVELVRLGRACFDPALVEIGVAVAERRAQRNPGCASLEALALHARGLAHEDIPRLERAVALLAESPRRLALASVVEDLGCLQTGPDAVTALSGAFDQYVDLGSTWDASRVRQRLRRLGVRRNLQTVRTDASSWAGLTQSEMDVVQLVARGRTNRQIATELFLSPHTINSHLRHVFAKLGIRSRVDLVRRYLDQHESLPDSQHE